MNEATRSARSVVGAEHSLRLRFDYDGDTYKLIAAYKIQKRPPRFVKPPEGIDTPEGMTGFWVEVRSEKGDLVHFLPMGHPLAHLGEAPGPSEDDSEKAGSYERSKSLDVATTFSVIIPDFGPEATVRLMGSPHDEQGITGTVTTLFEASGLKPTAPPRPQSENRSAEDADTDEGGN